MSDTSSQVREAFSAMLSHLNTGRSTVARPGGGSTSDLTIDEVLLLHSIGWEPVDLVCGASVGSVYAYTWQWGVGEIADASAAHTRAVATAVERISSECRSVGGHGVIGVSVEFTVHSHHIDAILVGTAVRPSGTGQPSAHPFVSDLSTRDFCLLHQAGWEPQGLAFGASFVHAPRRSAGTVLAQKGQNVELTNFTEALYEAREQAMERMQSSALGLGAQGVVAVQVREGPMSFAHHAIAFTAWGTAVAPGAGGHRYLRPRVVIPLDDMSVMFRATSLAGEKS
ncbi:MAG: heavy metal-binding domain-containing protein [Acidimicrobiaceae bacterium]|nr:heavy metal-binding domain-containing protein [Acidimicrobiaceae bacterium]